MKFCTILWMAGLPVIAVCLAFMACRSQSRILSPAPANSSPITSQPVPAPPEPSPASGNPKRGPVSPFTIKRYIAEHQGEEVVSLEEFWQRLGIETEQWRKYHKCKANIFRLQLDSKPGAEVMLRLYIPYGWEWGGDTRYLIFKLRKLHRKPVWELLGFIDFEDQRDHVPSQRVITIGNRHWLVLTLLADHGSNVGIYHDVWYEIDHRGVTPVLRYTSRKVITFFPHVYSSSRILGVNIESGKPRVTIRFSVRYGWDEGRGPEYTLWTKRKTASFTKLRDSKEFVLDRRRSSVTAQELKVIYGDEGIIPKELLKYHYPSLVKIAAGREGRAKAWLRIFLGTLEETPEISRLYQLMQKKRRP